MLNNEVIGVGGVVVDITDRERSEEAIRFQSELLAAAGQAVVAVNLDRVVIYWNDAAEAMYGWSTAEALGRTLDEVLPRNKPSDDDADMVSAMVQGESWSGDYEIERRDGSQVSVFVTNKPMFGPNGDLIAVIGIAIDVTERLAGERAQRQLSAIVDGSGDTILGTTMDGIVTTWNTAAQTMFGYAAADIVGRPVSLLAPEGRVHEQSGMRERLAAGGGHERLETVRVHQDGSLIEVLVTASTTKDERGQTTGMSVIMQDIGERLAIQRSLEASRARLAEAQRTAHLGSFEFDLVSSETTWSEEFSRIAGLDVCPASDPWLFFSLVHPDDQAALTSAWMKTREHGLTLNEEFRIVPANSEQRTVNVEYF